MENEHLVTFLKYHVEVFGTAEINCESKVVHTFATGQDENNIIHTMTIHENGLVLLSNSNPTEFWSNRKPILTVKDGIQIFTFENK